MNSRDCGCERQNKGSRFADALATAVAGFALYRAGVVLFSSFRSSVNLLYFGVAIPFASSVLVNNVGFKRFKIHSVFSSLLLLIALTHNLLLFALPRKPQDFAGLLAQITQGQLRVVRIEPVQDTVSFVIFSVADGLKDLSGTTSEDLSAAAPCVSSTSDLSGLTFDPAPFVIDGNDGKISASAATATALAARIAVSSALCATCALVPDFDSLSFELAKSGNIVGISFELAILSTIDLPPICGAVASTSFAQAVIITGTGTETVNIVVSTPAVSFEVRAFLIPPSISLLFLLPSSPPPLTFTYPYSLSLSLLPQHHDRPLQSLRWSCLRKNR